MVTDPRDVAVSGTFFFCLRLYNEAYGTEVDCFEAMMRTLCDSGVYADCRIPWAQRVRTYMEEKTFLLRYEDLLDDPLRELRRIIIFLGLSRSGTDLHAAIAKQSFVVTRKRAEESNNQGRIKVVRKRQRRGGFREHLIASQIARIKASCKAEMTALGYGV